MIIIHPIGDFLTELFPELKSKLSDEKLIVKTISDYYSISNIKPEVKVHNGFVEIRLHPAEIIDSDSKSVSGVAIRKGLQS